MFPCFQKSTEVGVVLQPNQFQYVHMSKEGLRTLQSIVIENRVALVFSFHQSSFSVRVEPMNLATAPLTLLFHTNTGMNMLAFPRDTPMNKVRAEVMQRFGLSSVALRVGERELKAQDDSQTLYNTGLQMGEIVCAHSNEDWTTHSCSPYMEESRLRQLHSKQTYLLESALKRKQFMNIGRQKVKVCLGVSWDKVGPVVAMSVIFKSAYRGRLLLPLSVPLPSTDAIRTTWRFGSSETRTSEPCSTPDWVIEAQKGNFTAEIQAQVVSSATAGVRCDYLACQNHAVDQSTRCQLHIIPVAEVRYLSQCVHLTPAQITQIFGQCEFLTDLSSSPTEGVGRKPSLASLELAAVLSASQAPADAAGGVGSPSAVDSVVSMGAASLKQNDNGNGNGNGKRDSREEEEDGDDDKDAKADDDKDDQEEAEEPETQSLWHLYRQNAEMKIPNATQGSNFESFRDDTASDKRAMLAQSSTPTGGSPSPSRGFVFPGFPATGTSTGSSLTMSTTTSVGVAHASSTTTMTTTTTITTRSTDTPDTAQEALAMFDPQSVNELVIATYTLLLASQTTANARPIDALREDYERIVHDSVDITTKWMRFFKKLIPVYVNLNMDENLSPAVSPSSADKKTKRLITPANEGLLLAFGKALLATPEAETVDEENDRLERDLLTAQHGDGDNQLAPVESLPLLLSQKHGWVEVERPFHTHSRSAVQFFHDGSEYFSSLAVALFKSTKVICILGWELYPWIRLQPNVPGSPTVGDLLKKKAAAGVKVWIQLWKPPLMKRVACGRETLSYFSRSKVRIRLATAAQAMGAYTKSHHQKMVLCDAGDENWVGYVGGIDITKGRWDTEHHSLCARSHKQERYNCEASTLNDDLESWPQQPWHDVHTKVRGPIIEDLWTNFQDRWRFTSKVELPKPNFGDFGASANAATDMPLTHEVSVRLVRSFHSKVRNILEQDIRTTYVRLISEAQKFIYIETQFFVDAHSLNRQGIRCNPIPKKICQTIKRHILADPETTFVVYVLIPMYPEGNPSDFVGAGPVLFLQWQTINACYKRINSYCQGPASHRHPEDFLKFVTLGRVDTNHFAPNAASVKAKLLAQKRRYMIYVHAKTMIVDDTAMIIGSANINERSMAGDRDTELCVVLRQPNGQALPLFVADGSSPRAGSPRTFLPPRRTNSDNELLAHTHDSAQSAGHKVKKHSPSDGDLPDRAPLPSQRTGALVSPASPPSPTAAAATATATATGNSGSPRGSSSEADGKLDKKAEREQRKRDKEDAERKRKDDKAEAERKRKEDKERERHEKLAALAKEKQDRLDAERRRRDEAERAKRDKLDKLEQERQAKADRERQKKEDADRRKAEKRGGKSPDKRLSGGTPTAASANAANANVANAATPNANAGAVAVAGGCGSDEKAAPASPSSKREPVLVLPVIAQFRNTLWERHLRLRFGDAHPASTTEERDRGLWLRPWDPDTRRHMHERLDANWRKFRGAQEMNGMMSYPMKWEATTQEVEACVLPDCEPSTTAGQWSPIVKEFGLYG